MQQSLRSMTTEEFERHKTALAVRRQEKPKQLTHRAVRYWSEISTGQYFFDRDDIEVEELMKIVQEDLIEFFKLYVFHDAPQRRKLSVHVVAANVPEEKAEPLVHANGATPLAPSPPLCKESQLVEDIAVFKKSLPLFPLGTSAGGSTVAASAKAKL